MIIRKLAPEDAEIWRKIRLEGLQKEPDKFLTQYDDVAELPLSKLAAQLGTSSTFVATDGDDPVASIGFFVDQRLGVQHKATIFAVYIRASYRGTGLADQLMQAVLDNVPDSVLQVHLHCATDNLRGVAFYQRHGFEICGTIPRDVLVNGVASDTYIMVRRLDT